MARAFGPGYYIRPEKPLVLPDDSEPEPDIVGLRGRPRDYRRQYPTHQEALLVLEVSRATLAYDQGEKASLYAEAGIEDYWILNLRDRQLEVRREPALLATGRYGYRTLRLFTPGMEVSPLADPAIMIEVSELLPPAAELDTAGQAGTAGEP